MFVLISITDFEIQGFEKDTPTPNFAETLPQLCCPGKTGFPGLKEKEKNRKRRYFDPSQDVFGNRST